MPKDTLTAAFFEIVSSGLKVNVLPRVRLEEQLTFGDANPIFTAAIRADVFQRHFELTSAYFNFIYASLIFHFLNNLLAKNLIL
jgi:hypothetical protein